MSESIEKVSSEQSTNLAALGNEIIAGMGDEKEIIGSKSSSLHFVSLLGLESKATNRRGVNGGNENKVPATVGVLLRTDEAIRVPRINVLKNKDTGIESNDIDYVHIEAGQEFPLNMYELMYLIIQPEYGGFLTHEGDDKGAYFSPKMASFNKGEAKLPTPTLNLRKGSIKDHFITVDQGNKESGFVIKPEFADAFGKLLEKAQRQPKAKSKAIPTPTAVAVALNQLLNKQLNA